MLLLRGRQLPMLMLFVVFCPSYFCTIDDDFAYLLSVFPGRYDNSWQVFEEMVTGSPQPLRHERLSMEIVPEHILIFPKHVATFYLQEYTRGDPLNIQRQKIYAFQINSTTKEIITKFYSFVDPTKFINAQEHPGLCQNLTWSDIVYMPGCDIKWERVESCLFRTSLIGRCVIVTNMSFEIEDSNDLTENYLTVNEKWTFVSNGSVFRSGTPYNLTKLDTPMAKESQGAEHPQSLLTTAVSSRQITTLHSERRRQLHGFAEIVTALSKALPVTLYIDVPRCKVGQSFYNSTESLDFLLEGYSTPIDLFEFFNSSVYGPFPFFGFSDAQIVRTSQGDMIQLREGKVVSVEGLMLRVSWLHPADYTIVTQIVFGCTLQDAAEANRGQVLPVASDPYLARVTSFSQMTVAIKGGYNFRFTVHYKECQQGPKVEAFAGGIIKGMNIDPNGKTVSFGLSTLITDYQDVGYVRDFGSGVIYEQGFYAAFTISDDYVQTFKREYIETFVCDMTTDSTQGSFDLYMY